MKQSSSQSAIQSLPFTGKRRVARAAVALSLVGGLLGLVGGTLLLGFGGRQASAEPPATEEVISFESTASKVSPSPADLAQAAAQLPAENKQPGDKPRAGKPVAGKKTNSPSPAGAEKHGAKSIGSGEKKSGPHKLPEFTPATEKAALGFVREHLPELAELLISLQEKHPREYERAVQDLARTQDKLNHLRGQDEVRYRRDLAAWQVKSRIQLLVVRIQMNPKSKELQAQLDQAIAQQVDLEREQLEAERERLEQRLSKVESQLGKLSEKQESIIAQRKKDWLASGDKAVQVNRAKGKQKSTITAPVRTETKTPTAP